MALKTIQSVVVAAGRTRDLSGNTGHASYSDTSVAANRQSNGT